MTIDSKCTCKSDLFKCLHCIVKKARKRQPRIDDIVTARFLEIDEKAINDFFDPNTNGMPEYYRED